MLWAGDVGWETWESIDRIEKGRQLRVEHHVEGPGPVKPGDKRGPTPILPPSDYFGHDEAASLTGGIRLSREEAARTGRSAIMCGDWETRRLWASPLDGKGP